MSGPEVELVVDLRTARTLRLCGKLRLTVFRRPR